VEFQDFGVAAPLEGGLVLKKSTAPVIDLSALVPPPSPATCCCLCVICFIEPSIQVMVLCGKRGLGHADRAGAPGLTLDVGRWSLAVWYATGITYEALTGQQIVSTKNYLPRHPVLMHPLDHVTQAIRV
jgi:hypothetical protein